MDKLLIFANKNGINIEKLSNGYLIYTKCTALLALDLKSAFKAIEFIKHYEKDNNL